jgi:hypothetical protein
MRRLVLVALASVALVGCGSGEKTYIPPGSYAGSTPDDQPFTLDVGDKIHVNKIEGKFVRRGVIEVKLHDVRETVACKVSDSKGEELHCTLRFTSDKFPKPITGVIDLMLL